MNSISARPVVQAPQPQATPRVKIDREVQVYQAMADMARDYIGGSATCSVSKRGRTISITLTGLPSYDGSTDSITLKVPTGYTKFTKNGFSMVPLSSHECKYMCGRKPFSHPHVFSDGTPCWNGNKMGSVFDLFVNLINTYTWKNVTTDSKKFGRFTDNPVRDEIIINTEYLVNGYKKRIAPLVRNWDIEPGKYFASHYNAKFSRILR